MCLASASASGEEASLHYRLLQVPARVTYWSVVDRRGREEFILRSHLEPTVELLDGSHHLFAMGRKL